MKYLGGRMANESIVVIPADLSNETSLRRVLRILVQNIDSILGLKSGTDNLLKLRESIDALEAATVSTEEESEVEELNKTELSSVKIDFDCRATNGDVTINKSSRVSSGTRTAQGVYLFVVEEDVNRDNSYFTSNKETTVTLASSTSMEVRVYTSGALDDSSTHVTVSGTYVS
jgi:hypothetical protein